MSEGGSSSRSQWSLYAIVVAVYVFWGGNFVFSKVAMREIPSALAAGMRTFIGAWALMAVYRRWRSEVVGQLARPRTAVSFFECPRVRPAPG